MRPQLKEYFTFNNREKRGIIVLSAILVLLLVAMNTVHLFIPEKQYDFTGFEEEILAFEAGIKAREAEAPERWPRKQYASTREKEDKKPAERFAFNPNNLPIEEWMRLGFSEKQAQSIHKYEHAGGSFAQKSDVKRLFVVDNDLYAELEPWIDLPEEAPKSTTEQWSNNKASWGSKSNWEKPSWKKDTTYQPYEPPIMEVNSATAEDFDKLYGIGAVLSERIVKYRDVQGGFQTIDQLGEVYGIKPEVLEKNRPYLTIEPAPIKKLNVNTCSIDELRKHCHIKWSVANSIVSYRKMHGDYSDLSELQNSELVSDEIMAKIAPLLEI